MRRLIDLDKLIDEAERRIESIDRLVASCNRDSKGYEEDFVAKMEGRKGGISDLIRYAEFLPITEAEEDPCEDCQEWFCDECRYKDRKRL